ncbi:helix-turn-helix transcriptional regulator [Paludisphaera borealis]|uniref:helix-turn-helix transcriptional regulator n=1 Tax=Paludisphaera borealis TaxID=1387353 RepID=UPI0035A32451
MPIILPPTAPRASSTPTLAPLLSITDLAQHLSCSRRVVERLRAAGKLPRPDLHVGKMPRWRVETIRTFIENGGRP